MTAINLVVTDLDGTLLSDDGKVSFFNRNIFHQLKQKKIFSTIATGRSIYSFRKVIKNDFPLDYLIFSSGLGIMDWQKQKIIYENRMNKSEVKEIYNLLIELKLDFMIQHPLPHNHKFHYKRMNNDISDFENRINLYCKHSSPLKNINELDSASQFIAIVPDGAETYRFLKAKLTNFQVIRATSPLDHQTTWIEIFPKGVSKGHTLESLTDFLGLNLQNSIGIGNDYNDIDFLDRTKYSFVVKNAPQILKNHYNVTKSNNENGFGLVIKKYI